MGPGEFWADEGRAPLTPEESKRGLLNPEQILGAYNRFMAQCIYLSPQTQAWMGERVKSLPANYLRMGGTAQSRIIPVSGGQVGIVCFAQADKRSLQEARNDALEAGRKLRGQVDLLIGVSPWGSDAERAFADQADGLYHIILGGGPGYGFGASVPGKNKGLLWARPEREGITVNLVEIKAWPDPALHIWEREANYTAEVIMLGPSIPSDPVILELLKEH
jgi:hypothetical protein